MVVAGWLESTWSSPPREGALIVDRSTYLPIADTDSIWRVQYFSCTSSSCLVI